MCYRTVATYAAALSFALCAALVFMPGVIHWFFGIEAHASSNFMARRAAMLFLGYGLLCYLSRNAPHTPLRDMICLSMSGMMAGVALMGLYEFWRGFAGVGILLAVAVELGFAYGFVRARGPDALAG